MEIVAGEGCVKYVLKYIMKGADMAIAEFDVHAPKKKAQPDQQQQQQTGQTTQPDQQQQTDQQPDQPGQQPRKQYSFDQFQQMRLARYRTAPEDYLEMYGNPLVRQSHKVRQINHINI